MKIEMILEREEKSLSDKSYFFWALKFERDEILKAEKDKHEFKILRDAVFFYSLASGHSFFPEEAATKRLLKKIKEDPGVSYVTFFIDDATLVTSVADRLIWKLFKSDGTFTMAEMLD